VENQLVYIDDRKIFEASYSRIDVTATEADIWRHFLQNGWRTLNTTWNDSARNACERTIWKGESSLAT